MPSLRLDALCENTIEQLKKGRKSGFTLAPGAGTEHLRRAMNKDILDEDILKTAEWIFGNGWRTLKLYFMVGLPGETIEDVRAIGELAKKVAAVAKQHGKRCSVTISVSSFIPKPHTPLQWARQASREETRERIHILRDALNRERNVELKHNAPEVSELEGAFSRGDRRLSDVILSAYQKGARFDAWTEFLRHDIWIRAFEENGIDPLEYLRERDPALPLPWDIVDTGVKREFLLNELWKARSGETTPDCRTAGCVSCKACPTGFSNITHEGRMDTFIPAMASDTPATQSASSQRHIMRIAYAKEGPAKYLSGLEIQSLWGRSLRRAGLPVAYSQGFNPSPRLSLSPALPVGTDSACEFLEAEFYLPVPASTLSQALAPHLPAGVRVLDTTAVPSGSPRLSDFDIASTYSVRPSGACVFPKEVTPEYAAKQFADLRAAERFPLVLVRESQVAEVDLRPLVDDFRVNDGAIFIRIIQGTGKGVRPTEAVSAILGITMPPETLVIRKESAELTPRRPKK